jgi:hypothetical protein
MTRWPYLLSISDMSLSLAARSERSDSQGEIMVISSSIQNRYPSTSTLMSKSSRTYRSGLTIRLAGGDDVAIIPGRSLPELPGRPGRSSCASTILSRTFPTSGT